MSFWKGILGILGILGYNGLAHGIMRHFTLVVHCLCIIVANKLWEWILHYIIHHSIIYRCITVIYCNSLLPLEFTIYRLTTSEPSAPLTPTVVPTSSTSVLSSEVSACDMRACGYDCCRHTHFRTKRSAAGTAVNLNFNHCRRLLEFFFKLDFFEIGIEHWKPTK